MAPSRHLVEPMQRLQTTLMLEPMSGEAQHSSPRSVLFVSAEPGDGKSTVAADLALVQSEGGEQVMLIEADFQRPVQARALGLEPDRGLSDVLTGRLALADALQVVHATPAQIARPPRPTARSRPPSEQRGPGGGLGARRGPSGPQSSCLARGRLRWPKPGALGRRGLRPRADRRARPPRRQRRDAAARHRRGDRARRPWSATPVNRRPRSSTSCSPAPPPRLSSAWWPTASPRAEISKYGAGATSQRRWPASLVGRSARRRARVFGGGGDPAVRSRRLHDAADHRLHSRSWRSAPRRWRWRSRCPSRMSRSCSG